MHEFDEFPFVVGQTHEGIDLLRYILIAIAYALTLLAIDVLAPSVTMVPA